MQGQKSKLPIKMDGMVVQVEGDDEEESEEEQVTRPVVQQSDSSDSEMSEDEYGGETNELYLELKMTEDRAQVLEAKKIQIATIATSILEDPEVNVCFQVVYAILIHRFVD